MPNYYLTNQAVDDLSKIWEYTFENWSENQADKYYNSLIDSCKTISLNPDLGKNYEGITEKLFGLKTNRHIIFYRIISFDEVEITRILHERMDLKTRILDK
jgi:toxin ParE1/3/4